MYVFDHHKRLHQSLASLDRLRCAAFLLAACERMVPCHEELCRVVGWDACPLRSILDDAWEMAQNRSAAECAESCRRLVWSCAFITPEKEDLQPLASSALQAVEATLSLLNLLAGSSLSSAARGAEVATDAIDFYLTVRGMDDDQIEDTPMMQRELARQAEDLEEVLAERDPLAAMRQKWYHRGVSILDPA